MKQLRIFCGFWLLATTCAIPVHLLYNPTFPGAIELPKENDVSSPPIKLKVPVVFYGTSFDTLFVNSNGLISFQTEIPNFFNIEFPLDYPLIAPFYTNVDTRAAGTVSYYESNDASLLQRATDNVRKFFSNHRDFKATSLFIVTWLEVGYYNQGSDKLNTYQAVLISNGEETFVEFLYPKNGIQWIQGTGDESGLPDARGQAGFISADGKLFILPGSGTEQVRNLEVWSNIDLPGQFIYQVDGEEIRAPDFTLHGNVEVNPPVSCAEAPTYCHVQAQCVDYEEGFCCQCKKQFYGNGKFCVKKDVPLRVNGKVSGKINEEPLENLDLQSYIVMKDGRAYTAISKIPESIGFSVQSLQILGGVIGYIFAKPVRDAPNGYQLTGGVFNHTATIRFLNTSQSVVIRQKYTGLDVFDQLRLEAHIQGEIPILPPDSKIDIDEYQEQYTRTAPGIIQMFSTRHFKYTENNEEIIQYFDVEQVFAFDYCKFENISAGETWKLKVGKNFISYEAREQIIRFGLSNKITPLGDVDPCEEGRSQCMANSVCVVDGDTFRCVCNPGYQQIYNGNETMCTDIDECQSGLHSCDYNSQCINEIGTYSCKCNPGFTGNGHVCENEFSCHNVVCTPNAECIESNRVAMCKCLPGFTGDGQTCNAIIDHSCHTANNCHQFGICTIDQNSGNYYCTCLPGYEGNGYECTKIEQVESSTETEPKVIKRCLVGVCWCPEGYSVDLNSPYCIPQYETTTQYPEITTITTNVSCNNLNNCDRNAQCVYSSETDNFSCKCNRGFDGDGYQCNASIVSCAEVNNCDPHATCAYNETLSKSTCVCNSGYEGDGQSCSIKAICASSQDCTETEECLLTITQRYECVCKEGYIRDTQHQCVKPSTCGGGICVDNAECLYDEQYQLHYCSCKSGYMGDGITECKLKPIGCNVDNKCGLHATCEYDPTTSLYQCKCEQGFYGDGFVCYTEINCHVDSTLCHPQASCVTDVNRRYVCQCNSGFTGNGTHCKQTPTHEGNFLLVNQGMATLRIPFEPTKKNPGKPVQVKDQTAVGLDIDCLEGRFYWGDIKRGAIRSASYNGSDKSDFITKGITSPEGLAVDWVSRNIYWTDSTRHTIEVASIEGKRRRILFDTNLVNPRGIAVHPQRGKIFWTDWDRAKPRIEWANADGTGREIFLQGESASLPSSLAIDFDNEVLCYADAGTKKIECVDIDTKTKQTAATDCVYPFAVTFTDKHIYWSDWISRQIGRVDKNTFQRLSPLPVPLGGSGVRLYGLVAVPQKCPTLTNVCQFYKDRCPVDHICLPNGAGSRSCVCTFNADNPSEPPACTV